MIRTGTSELMMRTMRSLDSVAKQLRDIQDRNMDSLCGYDPGCPVGIIPPDMYRLDSPVRCSQAAVWHLKAGTPPEHMMLQACDRHLAACVAMLHSAGHEPSMHEMGSACGLPRTFWVDTSGSSLCTGWEGMRELGLVTEIFSRIHSEPDGDRCVCECPACTPWQHLVGECDEVMDEIGITHLNYMRLSMEGRIN